MSEPAAQRDQATARYLKRALALNPVWESAAVCDLRSRAFKKPRLDRTTDSDTNQNAIVRARKSANTTLQRLQSEFWKLPIDELNTQLSSIEVELLPELQPVINRMRKIAEHRSDFPPLSQESWMVPELFQALKKSAVLPPTEAGYVRERFLRRIKSRQQLRRIKTAAKRLESAYPALYEIQRDWFQTLQKQKGVTKTVDPEYGSGGVEFSMPEFGWPAWLILFIVLRAIVAAMRMAGSN